MDLETQDVYIDYNYVNTPYVLPQLVDYQGNQAWLWLEQGKDETFCKFDNNTRQFNFYNMTIPENLKGIYKVDILVGDDHWLGSKQRTYTLTFKVDWAPEATIVPKVEDKSSKGAELTEMGVTGEIQIKFSEPTFLNPNYVPVPSPKNTRMLAHQEESVKNGTNTTWIIHEDPEPEVLIPDSFDDYVYQPEYIDQSVLDVYVEPGPY